MGTISRYGGVPIGKITLTKELKWENIIGKHPDRGVFQSGKSRQGCIIIRIKKKMSTTSL